MTTITDQSKKSYTVGSLNCGTTYRFEVVVFDTGGWRTASNKASKATSSCPDDGGDDPCCASSPFLEVWNGTAYVLDNNILPKSGVWDREEFNVEDYYRLSQPLVSKDGGYSIRVTEFEDEHTRLDSLTLLVVDHDQDVRIAVDRDGNVFTFEDPESPLSAFDNYGRNNLGVISIEDGIYYEGWHGDYVTLEFGKVPRPQARLLLKSDFGHIQKESVLVYVLVNDTWVHVDTIHDRVSFAWEVVDLSAYVPSESLTVRLSTTKNHRIDFAGLDTSPNQPVTLQEATLLDATHTDFGDVTLTLAQVDDQWVNITPGQTVTFSFSVPTLTEDARSFIVHSVGWYTHKYEPYIGEDLTIDGFNVSAAALFAQESPVFFWDVDAAHLVWHTGDGASYQGWSFSHSYAKEGEYTIAVDVHYADGHVATFRRHIVVTP